MEKKLSLQVEHKLVNAVKMMELEMYYSVVTIVKTFSQE